MQYYVILQKSESLIKVLSSWFIFIGKGAIVTLQYSLLSILISICIAIFLISVNFNKNPIINRMTSFYISIIRSTPLLLQLSIIYYGIPTLFNIKIHIFAAGIISFSINSSAYVYEILRGGINSINKGELEAATSLGVKKRDIILHILIPQSFINALPALIGEFINLIKETAIVSILGEEDIMRKANMIAAQKYDYLTPLLFAGIWYYFIIITLEFFIKKILQKNKTYD